MTLSELTDALPINKSKSLCVERLMRVLINSKFFTKLKISEDKEGYWLTPSSNLLLTDESTTNLMPFVLALLDPIFTDPFHHISEWFKNDDTTPFVTRDGRTFWEQTEQDLRFNLLFNESMASDTRLAASVILKDCRHVFEGLKSMMDVGGGTGTMAKAISDAFPGLKCSVLERPNVIAGLEGTANLTFITGDMFDSIPPCADAIFMKLILHDWSDEECVKILKNCKEAIPCKDNGGKLIIIDIVMDNKQRDHEKENNAFMETHILYDVLMMGLTSGRERTEEDWAKLFYEAGFTSYKITNVLGFRSLIEVFP
ncbi:hypothetical protein DH2020_011436 [Rehmannia glutinosa]|uniref:Trans-resveratrol di-O-methyltransferase n=1 Tax=Rehmannia glutinosa TaxID=99300 RepID=A0ABR0XDC6_REHGL